MHKHMKTHKQAQNTELSNRLQGTGKDHSPAYNDQEILLY